MTLENVLSPHKASSLSNQVNFLTACGCYTLKTQTQERKCGLECICWVKPSHAVAHTAWEGILFADHWRINNFSLSFNLHYVHFLMASSWFVCSAIAFALLLISPPRLIKRKRQVAASSHKLRKPPHLNMSPIWVCMKLMRHEIGFTASNERGNPPLATCKTQAY